MCVAHIPHLYNTHTHLHTQEKEAGRRYPEGAILNYVGRVVLAQTGIVCAEDLNEGRDQAPEIQSHSLDLEQA